jgi:hypothetical protein
MNLQKIAAGTLLLSLLAACGGGGGGSDETPTADDRKVPASALASASAYSQWAGSLARSDTGEAVTVEAGMTAPKSETEEPIALR